MGYSRAAAIPFGLTLNDCSFIGAPIMSGVPVLDEDINLMSHINFKRMTDEMERRYATGWTKPGQISGNAANDNTVFLADSEIYQNGYLSTIKGSFTALNKVTFPAPPSSGSRVDIAFVEFWVERVTSAGTFFKYGNADYYTTNPVNDIVDPAIGLPATERLQLRYRIRTLADATDLLDTDCHVRGKKAAEDSTKHFLWDSTKQCYYCNAGVAFDDYSGYVYAFPICTVDRPQNDGNIPGTAIHDKRAISYDKQGTLYQGVSWDETLDTYTRTGSLVGQTKGVSPGNSFLPVHRAMRACLLLDDGTVNYYLCDTNWGFKEDGVTASVLTGADGQVMIEIPKCWYRYGYVGTSHTWEVAPVPLTGFVAHPAFQKEIGSFIIGNDSTFAGASNWGNVDINAYDETTDLTITATAANQYCTLPVANAPTTIGKRYKLVFDAANLVATWTIKSFDGTQVIGKVTAIGTQKILEYTAQTTGGLRIVADATTSSADFDNFYQYELAELNYVYYAAYEGVLYDSSAARYANGLHQTAFSCTFDIAKTITAGSRTAPFKNLAVGDKFVCSGTASNNQTFTVTVPGDIVITVAEAVTGEVAPNTVICVEASATALTGDKLSSVSGFNPICQAGAVGTRAHFRQYAANRGSGWSQVFRDVDSLVQTLALIEYASFYTQSVIGAGISAVGDWAAYNDYNPISKTGNANAIGNATGNTAGSALCATEVTKYMKYRGIENWYGHIWKWLDGFNVSTNVPYLCNNPINFADDTLVNYTRPYDVLGVAITMINANGYQSTLKKSGRGFMPATIGADGATKITDYYYQTTGWTVANSGGAAYLGASDGGFSLLVNHVASYLILHVGGRLCYRK